AVTGNRLRRHVGAAFAAGAILFAVSTVASFAVAERLPFNALAVIWEPRQLLYLLVLYRSSAQPPASASRLLPSRSGLAALTVTTWSAPAWERLGSCLL